MQTFPDWLNIHNDLLCPICQGTLEHANDGQAMQCQHCKQTYEIKDGIPYFIDPNDLSAFENQESTFHSKIANEADKAHGQQTLRAALLHDGFMEPILALPKGSMVLDLACGSGTDLIRLAQAGYHVIGVDISPGMLRVTREKAQKLNVLDNIFLCVATARKLPFHNDNFQAAYICAGLHHMQMPRIVVEELARVTEHNGIVAIGSEPNAWIYRFRGLKHSKLGERIMRLFRNDYTIGEQPPGDEHTPGWTAKDWPALVRGTSLELAKVNPIWYLNGIASLLGLHTLPRWFETILCHIDGLLSRIPLIRNYSVKWNVITKKKSGACL